MPSQSHTIRMARFTGPRRRIIRRLGTELPGLTTRTQEGREYPPGQHGGLARRRRPSEYAIRLREKQKLRMYYGLTERQMRTAAKKAAAGRGITGQELLRGLESRLDNAVFRLGLAATIPAARQLVRHGHIMVDGKRATFPSEGLHTGARVEVEPGSRKLLPIAEAIAVGPRLRVPSWLRRDDDGLGGVVVTSPPREDVPFEVRENLVVEFYAR